VIFDICESLKNTYLRCFTFKAHFFAMMSNKKVGQKRFEDHPVYFEFSKL
jgi:hypothetical protein